MAAGSHGDPDGNEGGDDTPAALAGMGQGVADKVHAAALSHE
jgi:hypothetical protein